jgi:hypothetical protein
MFGMEPMYGGNISHSCSLGSFRQQYRLERLLFSKSTWNDGDRNNDQSFHSKETKVLGTKTYQGIGVETLAPEPCTVQMKGNLGHCISRIVVIHNNIRDIFVHEDHVHLPPLPGGDGVVKVVNSSDHFFDNDNFWNGSLTWFDHPSASTGRSAINRPTDMVTTNL